MSAVLGPTVAFRVKLLLAILVCSLGAALLASSKPAEQSRITF
jgi:hypothetical protein